MRRTPLHRWAAVGAALALQLSSVRIAIAAVDAPPPPPPPPTPTAEEDQGVEELNASAIEAFKAKEYDEAARLFELAYDKSPEPNYLFNIGRVYEEKGDFPAAIEYYDRFIHLPEVDLESREIALDRLKVLRQIVEEEEAKKQAAETPAEPPPKTDDGGKPPTPPIRIAGYVLLGLGGVTLGVAAAFGGIALQRENDLDNLSTLEPRNESIRKGKRSAIVADSLFITGGVIALTGLVLTLVSLRKGGGKGKRASVTPALGPGHAGLAAHMRF